MDSTTSKLHPGLNRGRIIFENVDYLVLITNIVIIAVSITLPIGIATRSVSILAPIVAFFSFLLGILVSIGIKLIKKHQSRSFGKQQKLI